MEPDLTTYDTIVVAFSGGKDSLACLLTLLDQDLGGRIELWHHEIDGREGSRLMDWPCTPAYCRAVAAAFALPIYFSWREGGFEREMCRANQRTAAVRFEMPDGTVGRTGGTSGKPETRRKFPQVTASLSQRWCSAYLKIDIAAAALRNQDRFRGKRTLFVTGERAEESSARRNYACWETHRTDARGSSTLARHVDHLRPVHSWTETQVWEIVERYKVNPHPAYHLGYGRCSCLHCIFGNDDQWATNAHISPRGLERIAQYEESFGVTIHRTRPVRDRTRTGQAYAAAVWNPHMVEIAMATEYNEPIFLGEWHPPPGAYAKTPGPI